MAFLGDLIKKAQEKKNKPASTPAAPPPTPAAVSSLGAVAPIAMPEMKWTTPTGETPSQESQSGAMHAGFVSALTKLQQKSRAMGGATTPDDLATVARGYFGQATERMSQKRGLDIEDRRITSAERMHELGLITEAELGRQKLASAERLQKAGLISEAELEREKIVATKAMHKEEIELEYYKARTQKEAAEEAMEETGGLLGGGGFLGFGCIIISACTSPDSHEVDLAREYRDKCLHPAPLAGYYALSHKVVPFIVKSRGLKWLVKRALVDRLADYFEWFLGYKSQCKFRTSEYVTRNFLRFCRSIGCRMSHQKAVKHLRAHAGRTSPVTQKEDNPDGSTDNSSLSGHASTNGPRQ